MKKNNFPLTLMAGVALGLLVSAIVAVTLLSTSIAWPLKVKLAERIDSNSLRLLLADQTEALWPDDAKRQILAAAARGDVALREANTSVTKLSQILELHSDPRIRGAALVERSKIYQRFGRYEKAMEDLHEILKLIEVYPLDAQFGFGDKAYFTEELKKASELKRLEAQTGNADKSTE